MKTLAATAILTGIIGSVAFAQGTVNIANGGNALLNAPDYQSDGTTKLESPQYMAQLPGWLPTPHRLPLRGQKIISLRAISC